MGVEGEINAASCQSPVLISLAVELLLETHFTLIGMTQIKDICWHESKVSHWSNLSHIRD